MDISKEEMDERLRCLVLGALRSIVHYFDDGEGSSWAEALAQWEDVRGFGFDTLFSSPRIVQALADVETVWSALPRIHVDPLPKARYEYSRTAEVARDLVWTECRSLL